MLRDTSRPLLAALLLLLPLAPAFAQEGTGARISPDRPRGAAPRGEEPRPATAAGIDDPATLLRMAQRLVAEGRLYQAGDLTERAQARLLTRSELASRAGRPVVGGVIGEIAAAREAVLRRDRADAEARLGAAIAALEGPTTGGGGGPEGAWGGGWPPR
jgi:hypothetical protein